MKEPGADNRYYFAGRLRALLLLTRQDEADKSPSMKKASVHPETILTGGIGKNPEQCRSQNSYYSRIYIGE
jgi:hypothetical protein